MPPPRVVILGAGFGGLELATRLSVALGEDVDVTLIDQSDAFAFGFSKLDVMFGRKRTEDVRTPYRRIDKPGVRFVQEVVTAIDPTGRRVQTDHGPHEADVLVVALGADLDPAATPGFVEGGYDFYDAEGAAGLTDVLAAFDAGALVVGVLGPLFKCPPAPCETALMLDDLFRARGRREAVTITLISPMGSPVPVSPETSAVIVEAFDERGIEFLPDCRVTGLDPQARRVELADGRAVAYDLFLGVPVHRAPPVVVDSGLTVDGWIPVDPATMQTPFPDVYAVGDVTSAPVPRAGVFAEGEAGTLADVLIDRFTGGTAARPYEGAGSCYIEFGGDRVGRVDVNFLGGAGPTAKFNPPTHALAAEKEDFGSSRLSRWFGA